MSAEIAIIGGTGLTSMAGLSITRREMIKTPYGSPSGPLIFGDLDGGAVVFLARHGHKHSIPPHRINYRANIWALESVGIKRVVAVGAVGGITGCDTGDVVIPDQIIDYTQSRQGTYYDGKPYEVRHVDFSYPYDAKLRATLIDAGKQASVNLIEGGVYGVTQGPRLETAAEIDRMANDGCTIVGMTAMPEAALACELGMAYASLAVVINPAAGRNAQAIDTTALEAAIPACMEKARKLLVTAMPALTGN